MEKSVEKLGVRVERVLVRREIKEEAISCGY